VSGEFPEPPNGSPGGVRGAARAIGRAGEALADVGSGLKGASGALAADWNGWAAGSYQSCVQGLAGPLRIGMDQFQACEKAIMSYADALEHAQDEIKRLHGLWVAAKEREAAALSQVNALSTQLATAKPKEVDGIQSDLSAASTAASGAGGEAAQLVIKANGVLEEFKSEAAAQADVLSGSNPFTPGTLLLGPGAGLFGGTGSALTFGVPAGGLDPLRGVITVQHPKEDYHVGPEEVIITPSRWAIFNGGTAETEATRDDMWESDNIPGYENWAEHREGHPEDAIEPDDSIFNPVGLLAGGAAGAFGKGALRSLGALTDALFVRGGKEAVEAAARQARAEAAAILSPNTRHVDEAIEAAGRNAGFKKQYEIDEARGANIKALIELAEKGGAKVPPGTADIVGHMVSGSTVYKGQAALRLRYAKMMLEQQGSKPALKAAQALDGLIARLER
jgi:uncharacterized protein YukE